jgi:hypothetical protein
MNAGRSDPLDIAQVHRYPIVDLKQTNSNNSKNTEIAMKKLY